jgi:cell division protein FtsN
MACHQDLEAYIPEVGASAQRFAAQLGAFSDPERAQALLGLASSAGLDARLVRVSGSPLIRVRVGLFDSEMGAAEVLRQIEELGLPAALVRDARRELPIPR